MNKAGLDIYALMTLYGISALQVLTILIKMSYFKSFVFVFEFETFKP